jgi:hypothetical protein
MWSSSKSLPSWSTSTTSSSASTKVKSWTQAFTSTLLTLGEEEVLIDSNKSIAQSTLSVGLIRRQSSVRCNVPEVTQPQVPAARENSFTQRSIQNNHQHLEQQDCMSVVTYDNPSYLEVQQKDDELRELNAKYNHQESALRETRTELKNLKLEYRKKVHELTITMDDLQWQKTSLQERLSDLEDEDLEYIEQLQHVVQEEAPKEISSSLSSFLTNNQQATQKDRLAHHLNRHQQEGLMKDNSEQDDDDDNRSRASVRSTTSGFGGRWGLSLNRSSQAQQNQILQSYTSHLQAKLVEAMYKIKTLTEKISTMEQAQEDQMSKVIHMIKESEQERARLEVELESRVGEIQGEKALQEIALQAKLDTKDDKIRRLEEYIEELREASQSTNITQQKLEIQSQLTTMKEEHMTEMRKLKEQHHVELEQLQTVINRCKLQNESLEKELCALKANGNASSKALDEGKKEEQNTNSHVAVVTGNSSMTPYSGKHRSSSRSRDAKDFHHGLNHRRSSSSASSSGGYNASSRQSPSHSDTSSRRHRLRNPTTSRERSSHQAIVTSKSFKEKPCSTLHQLDDDDDDDDDVEDPCLTELTSVASYEDDDFKLPGK